MSKKQVLNEIIDLYDENEMLKGKIKEFLTIKTGICIDETEKDKAIENLEFEAKKLLFDRVIYDWRLSCVNIEVKEDSGEINFLNFEQWFKSLNMKDIISSGYENLFENLTFNEVKDYFRPQFEEYFKKRVNDKKMELVRAKKDE